MDQFPQGNPRLQDLARHMQRIILPVRRRHIPHQTVGGVIWTPKQMNNPTASMCMDVYLHIIVFICINVIYRYTNGIHVLILSWKLTCEYRPNIAKKNIYIYIFQGELWNIQKHETTPKLLPKNDMSCRTMLKADHLSPISYFSKCFRHFRRISLQTSTEQRQQNQWLTIHYLHDTHWFIGILVMA